MKDIIVFGHQNPDTDSIAGAICYAHYLRERGEDAEAVALGEVNDETAYALDKFSFEAPRVIERVQGEGKRVALVDHNEFQQSAPDIAEADIYSVVDHHKIGNFQTSGPLYFRAEPIGSTCSILYKLYKENDVEIPADIAGLMVSAITSDTLLLTSPTTSEEDKVILEELAAIAGVDVDEYGTEMLKAGANPDKKSAEEILEGDAKTYEFGDEAFRIGQVNVVDVEDVLKRKEEILEEMNGIMEADGYSNYLLVVTDILKSTSVGLVQGARAEEIASFFSQDLEDGAFSMEGVVSRKKQVVPPISDKYQDLPAGE